MLLLVTCMFLYVQMWVDNNTKQRTTTKTIFSASNPRSRLYGERKCEPKYKYICKNVMFTHARVPKLECQRTWCETELRKAIMFCASILTESAHRSPNSQKQNQSVYQYNYRYLLYLYKPTKGQALYTRNEIQAPSHTLYYLLQLSSRTIINDQYTALLLDHQFQIQRNQ